MPDTSVTPGQRFGLLTTVELVIVHVATQRATAGALWQCACDCGTLTVVPELQLVSGARDNCGFRMGMSRSSRRQPPTEDATKVCTKCGGEPQPLAHFPIDWSSPYGRAQPCKRCAAARRRQRRAQHLKGVS